MGNSEDRSVLAGYPSVFIGKQNDLPKEWSVTNVQNILFLKPDFN
jgi:hypothetical protein